MILQLFWLIFLILNREKTAADTGNYVKVKGENKGCYSYVGMLNWGAQDLNLGNGCHSDRYLFSSMNISIHVTLLLLK